MTIAQWLLDALLEAIELFPQPFETPRAHLRRIEGWPREFPRHRVKYEVERMKKRGWVIEAEKQGKKFLKLTKKGRLAALNRRISVLQKATKKQWDGRWVMAVFDIPEKGREERDTIRRVLKSVGFYPLQKSVYVYPYETPKELTDYLNDAKLLRFVRFAQVERMDDAHDLKKHFSL